MTVYAEWKDLQFGSEKHLDEVRVQSGEADAPLAADSIYISEPRPK